MQSHQNNLGNVIRKVHKYQKHVLQFLTKDQLYHIQTSYPSLEDFECKGQIYSLFLDDADSKRLQSSFSEPYYFIVSSDSTECGKVPIQRLIEVMSDRSLLLACAESCTGGALAALISSIPGSSKVFWGSLVIYSDDAKIRLLGIDSSAIQRYSSISPECSRLLQEAVEQKSNTTCTVAITGVCGPGKVGNTIPGTVYIVIASPGKRFIYYCSIKGNRQEVRDIALQSACFLLHEQLLLRMIPENERVFSKITIKIDKIIDRL